MTAADRPSVTDDARAEAVVATATTEDVLNEEWLRATCRKVILALPRDDESLIVSCTPAFEVADTAVRIVREAATKALADAGLLATARTRPTETTTEWGVRFYGRGPFDMPCEDRDDAEAEVDQVEDKHAPAVLIRREVTAWTEAE